VEQDKEWRGPRFGDGTLEVKLKHKANANDIYGGRGLEVCPKEV